MTQQIPSYFELRVHFSCLPSYREEIVLPHKAFCPTFNDDKSLKSPFVLANPFNKDSDALCDPFVCGRSLRLAWIPPLSSSSTLTVVSQLMQAKSGGKQNESSAQRYEPAFAIGKE